jgi:hypothetical protein
MLATFPKFRRQPRTSAETVRQLLLEIAYRMHTTAVVVRPRPARCPRSSFRPTAPR